MLSNLYPAHAVGGYERMCRDVVQRFRHRGHEVAVLTTRFRADGSASEAEEQGVHRNLGFYWDGREIVCPPLWRQGLIERGNRRCLGRLLDAFAPNVVSVWGMGGLSLGLLALLARRRVPLVYVVGDDWLVYGSWADCWMRRFADRDTVAGLLALATRLATRPPDIGATGAFCFASEFIRRRAEEVGGWAFPIATVTYAGIDRGDFPPATDPQSERSWRWRLLCVGRLTEQKGLETAVRALASLPAEATLEIVAGGDREYGRQLEALAASLGVAERLRLLPPVERAACVIATSPPTRSSSRALGRRHSGWWPSKPWPAGRRWSRLASAGRRSSSSTGPIASASHPAMQGDSRRR